MTNRIRLSIVFFVAKLFGVPINVRDEFWLGYLDTEELAEARCASKGA